MSYITVDSSKILNAYSKYIAARNKRIEKETNELIDSYIHKNVEHRKRWYGFLVSELTREQVLNNLKKIDKFYSPLYEIKFRGSVQSDVFTQLYTAAKHSETVCVSVENFSQIEAWIEK
jgi:ribosome-associated translation inhibitor RaiA